MSHHLNPLNAYKKNIYSQNGEDGILEEIIKRIGISANFGWCVEFGAWDGIHLSNTFNLVASGWSAVYIEGDPNKYKDLLNTASFHAKITPINRYVDYRLNSENCLDNILATTKISNNFDILSIDIDSYDLDVWDSLKKYIPKIIVIEINSSIKPGIFHRHTEKLSGNSFSSTLQVGVAKDYTLVCHTGNLIFVHNTFINKLNMPEKFINEPDALLMIVG